MSGPSAQSVLDSGRSRLLLRLFFVVIALACGWFVLGASTPASASENAPGPLLGSLGTTVSSTVDAVKAPVAAVIAPAPVAAPVAPVAPVPAAVPVAPAPVPAPAAPTAAPTIPAPAAPTPSAPASLVSTVGDVADSALDLVGSELVSSTTAPVVAGLDGVLAGLPVTDGILGSTPLTSVTAPLTGAVDDTLSSGASDLSAIVDGVTGSVDDDVIVPILGGVPVDPSRSIDLLPSIGENATSSTRPGGVGNDAHTVRPVQATDDDSPASRASTGTAPAPFSPLLPAAPSAPSAPSPASSANGSSAGPSTTATTAEGFFFQLTAARLAFVADDASPFSLSSDPGSSPD